MSHGAERLASFLEREAMEYLRKRARIPEGAFFSVSRAVLDDSLGSAKIFISVFPDKFAKEIFLEIARMEKDTKKHIASRLSRHKMPQLKFVLEKDSAKQIHLEKLLDDIDKK